uniref:Uncharacterized protein n=1 Tax=Desertifilum tharense IPPAS B-1220 TaxID=1781255 RepID=A0ACD5GZ10_9CYAN
MGGSGGYNTPVIISDLAAGYFDKLSNNMDTPRESIPLNGDETSIY